MNIVKIVNIKRMQNSIVLNNATQEKLITLGKKEFRKRSTKVKSIEEKWDEKCKQAIILYNQGVNYPDIAKEMGCHVSNLYKELKKRGWLQM